MNANDLLARYGEHPERIMIAQFLLGGERQSRQITQRLQVVGMESCPLECGAIVRHVIVGVPQRPLQTLQLQRLELLAARRLDRLEITGRGLSDRHASSYEGSTTWPLMRYDLPRKNATRSPRWLVTSMSYTPVRPLTLRSWATAVRRSPSCAGATKSIAQPDATVVRL